MPARYTPAALRTSLYKYSQAPGAGGQPHKYGHAPRTLMRHTGKAHD